MKTETQKTKIFFKKSNINIEKLNYSKELKQKHNQAQNIQKKTKYSKKLKK